MDRREHDQADRKARSRRRFPAAVETLEDRRLLSYYGSYNSYYNQTYYQAQIVRHQYDQFVSEVKRIELASQATPAEYLALRDDARAISNTATPDPGLSRQAVQYKAVETSLELDRAPLYGWLGNSGWAGINARLTSDLSGLNVPSTLIAQTVADMRTLATSANVGPFDYAAVTNDFTSLRNAEQSLPSSSGYHFEDPSLFYTQHLRGFFRGWGVQKVQARGQLDRDLHAAQSQAVTSPAGAVVVTRDVGILQKIGAAIPSTTNETFGATYVAAFAQGPPSPTAVAQLGTSLVTVLGPAATPSRVAWVDRLANDAPAFDQALGGSASSIATIVADVAALVDAGSGESLNPFKINVRPG